METQIWTEYGKTEVNEKIRFWVDVWEDLIDYFGQNVYGLDLLSPHVLLRLLVDEVKDNELRNEEMRHLLLDRLSDAAKNDNIIKAHLASEFALICAELNSSNLFYLLQACQNALSFFEDGRYFRASHSKLIDVLSQDNWNPGEDDSIRSTANNLIVELLLKGFGLESIRKMPRSLFSNYKEIQTYISTDFPHEIEWRDFMSNDKFDNEAFANAVRTKMGVLCIKDWLEALNRFYSKNAEEVYVLFPIEGIKGHAAVSMGDITFYSPAERPFLKESEGTTTNPEWELFQKSKFEAFNVAVRVSMIDIQAGLVKAAELANHALDLLGFQFTTKINLSIVAGHYIVVRPDGTLYSQGGKAPERPSSGPLKLHYSLDLSKAHVAERVSEDVTPALAYILTPKHQQSQVEEKITQSLHWYRKALESDSLEDQLLNYWIVTEKVFAFPESNSQLLSPVRKKESRIDRIYDKILYAKRFYEDRAFARTELLRHIKRTKDDLILIYHFRNSIVHNAHYDSSLLEPYAKKAQEIAATLLSLIMHQHKMKPSTTVEEVFVSRHIELRNILTRLDKNEPLNLDLEIWRN